MNNKTFHAYRINIKDKQMANDLRSYGLTNNKSYDAFIPSENQIPNNLFRHYIRGMFDGDGSIYNGANGINISVTTGSEQMQKDFFNAIKKHLNIKMSVRERNAIFDLRLFSKKMSINFLAGYTTTTLYALKENIINLKMPTQDKSYRSPKHMRAELSGKAGV